MRVGRVPLVFLVLEVRQKHQEMDKKRASNVLLIIFIGLLIDLLSFTIILPLLPRVLDYYHSKPVPDPSYTYLLNLLHSFRSYIGGNSKDSKLDM
jgi:hypothetical protein